MKCIQRQEGCCSVMMQESQIYQFLEEQLQRINQWGISYERIPLTWKDLNSIPEQIYVLHLTPKEIVYTTDPNLKKLYNATVTKTEDEITVKIIWLKCLYIDDVKVWSNIVFAYKCLKFNSNWAQKTNLLVDSMLLTITCTKNNEVTIEPHVMNVVKPRLSKRPTSKLMIKEVSKIYKQLKRLQNEIAERGEVFVTSWGIPLNETELTEIMRLLEKVKR